MSTTAVRTIVATLTGDQQDSWPLVSGQNTNSPAAISQLTLASGTNTIPLPTGGATVVAAMIQPPVGNTAAITLKGSTTDTGILIHKTDPTVITFDSSTTAPTSIYLVAGTTVTGLRIFWL